MLIFKYLNELSQVNEYVRCPCVDASSVNMMAFRYISTSKDSEENFIPQSIKDHREGRQQRVFPPDSESNCEYHGLSMFNTRDNAVFFWTKVLKPKVRSLLGYNVLFSGIIEENDGVITPLDKKGHFNLYEYVNVNLGVKFTHVENI